MQPFAGGRPIISLSNFYKKRNIKTLIDLKFFLETAASPQTIKIR